MISRHFRRSGREFAFPEGSGREIRTYFFYSISCLIQFQLVDVGKKSGWVKSNKSQLLWPCWDGTGNPDFFLNSNDEKWYGKNEKELYT